MTTRDAQRAQTPGHLPHSICHALRGETPAIGNPPTALAAHSGEFHPQARRETQKKGPEKTTAVTERRRGGSGAFREVGGPHKRWHSALAAGGLSEGAWSGSGGGPRAGVRGTLEAVAVGARRVQGRSPRPPRRPPGVGVLSSSLSEPWLAAALPLSQGRRLPSSQPLCGCAPARPGPTMLCSWAGCCRLGGAPGPAPPLWSAARVIAPPRGPRRARLLALDGFGLWPRGPCRLAPPGRSPLQEARRLQPQRCLASGPWPGAADA